MGVVCKPFYKVITSVTNGTQINVRLADTAGSSINCNYAIVESNAGVAGGTGFMVVTPSNSGKALYADFDVDASGTVLQIGGTSGAAGVAVNPFVEPIEIQTWGGDSFDALVIDNRTNATSILITYGVRRQPTTLMDSKSDSGV